MGSALWKVTDYDDDDSAVHFAYAAEIVRQEMFNSSGCFNGSFAEHCQENSVSKKLLAHINMILEGSNITNQTERSL
jgi:hypothetical protein